MIRCPMRGEGNLKESKKEPFGPLRGLMQEGERMTNHKALLKEAVSLIKAWHNFHPCGILKEKEAEKMWNIYYNHAPEMKRIREAIEK